MFSQERPWYQPVHYVPGFTYGRHAAVLHQHHDEVLKPVVTNFPWVSLRLLYDLADVLPERVDFVAALRRVGVIIVFLRSTPHKTGSNVRDANGVGDSQAR